MIVSNCNSNIDLILNFYFFKNKHNGIYLEAGANDGKTDSISYFFEKNFNWKGILVEPQHELMEKCKKVRSNSNIFIEKGLGDKNGKEEITIPIDNLDNASITLSPEHINELHRLGYGKEFKKETIDVISYSTLVKRKKITHIDLAIIDVEGYEANILRSIIKSEVLPDILVVEFDWSELKELINILESKYEIFDKFSHDIVFKRK